MRKIFFSIFVVLFSFLLLNAQISADEYSATSYKVLDPVITPSHYSTSGSFKLISTLSEVGIGTSTATNFKLFAGSLYFPVASSPVVSATAGDAQVALTWSASDGFLGWTALGYRVGQSTVSGGAYSYTSLGNVLNSTRTGLTNSTTYYFVIVAEDALGNAIATSTEVSATPVASSPTPGGGGGGGGGGVGGSSGGVVGTGVEFVGRAYPLSKVSILKDGQLAVTTIAGPDSNFSVLLNNLTSGNYTFSVYSEDSSKNRSSPFTFPIFITENIITKISGIFIAPTIAVDKATVKKGDSIAIFGQSTPDADVVINVNSETPYFVTKKSDNSGVYLVNFDTSVLELGAHNTKSKAIKGGEISQFSNTVNFKVGNQNLPLEPATCSLKADLNADCKVNLVDFSILAYWYKKSSPPPEKDLNADGQINLVDFSIMAYHWTG